MPSDVRIDRRPLWPLSPPPNLTRSCPGSMSSSSWTTISWSGLQLEDSASSRRDRPSRSRSCNVRDLASDQPLGRLAPGGPNARLGDLGPDAAWRARTAHPSRRGQLVDDQEADVVPVAPRTSGPGLPRPTTSQRSWRDCSLPRELRPLGSAGASSRPSARRRRLPRSARCRPPPRPRPARPRAASAVCAA